MMVAAMAARHPAVVVPALFGHLDDRAAPAKRRNALHVLKTLFGPASPSSIAPDESSPVSSSSHVSRLSPALAAAVAEQLLARLGDDELQLRVSAAALFSRLDPTFVVAPLAAKLADADARVRAAAEECVCICCVCCVCVCICVY
jgi:hypothetical protein